jgi:di/tricarboxylate transporter
MVYSCASAAVGQDESVVTGEIQFVFVLIAVAAAMMASNRIRFDVIALLVVLALMLSGVLTVGEALSGFGSSVVILVAGLLVVGEMLDRTGVARAMGDLILTHGGTSESRLLIVIMIAAALLGAVMSSTAIVAIFIPIVMRISAEAGLSASRFLIPVSYAALISGMLTLIATPPNLVIHAELVDAGFDGFGFFSFSLVGCAVLAVAVVFMLLFGRRLLRKPDEDATGGVSGRSMTELWEDFRIRREVGAYRIERGSPLIGSTIAASEIESLYRVRIIGLLRRERRGPVRIPAPGPETELHASDELIVVGEGEDKSRMIGKLGLVRLPDTERYWQRWLWEIGGASVLVHPESALIGKTLIEAQVRSTYGFHVLGLRRGGEAVDDFTDTKLMASDSLWVVGAWASLRKLKTLTHDFVVMEVPTEYEEIVPEYRRMPTGLAILATMVGLSIFDVVPLVAAVILAVLAAVATRCLTMEDAYRSIHWSSIVLVAGMLPLADALQQTGGSDLIVAGLMHAVGESGPRVMLTVLFFLTAGLSLFLSNTAAAVLVAPIAITAAEVLGVSPYPFAIAVLIAASAAFATPVSTPVVTLVVEPGRYKFMDFVKLGVPLLLLVYVVTLLLAPVIFPYG